MTDDGDVTQWLEGLAQHDQQAIQRIWEQYYQFEGFTNEEIARSLECAVGTEERKLARIRKKWSGEPPA